MPTFNTIVVDPVNTNVVVVRGVIARMTALDTLADRLVHARTVRGFTQETLAAAADCTQQTIGNYEGARGRELSDHKRKAHLVEIAKVLSVSLEWLRTGEGKSGLDEDQVMVRISGQPPSSAEIFTGNRGLPLSSGRRSLDNIPFHSAPITRWPKRDEELNNRLRLVGRMAAIPGQYSDQTQVVQVGEDAMKPEIEDGEFIAVDPMISARNGDVVIVKDGLGDFHLRRYRPTMGGAFEAWAPNQYFATLDSSRHGLTVAAVMVCHMKLRHP